MPETAYFAGFFDADGSVSIGRGWGTSYFLLSVRVANTTTDVLHRYAERFGGSVNGPHARGPRHKPAYFWAADAKVAEAFLREIVPHLIVKRERVELALTFRDLFRGEFVIPRGHALDSPRNRAKRVRIMRAREECFERMALLNKRGVS